MIPLIAVIHIKEKGQQRGMRLWIPLFLLYILLIPIAIFLFPFFLLICLVSIVNPVTAMTLVWEMFCALKGTHIEVTEPDSFVRIKII